MYTSQLGQLEAERQLAQITAQLVAGGRGMDDANHRQHMDVLQTAANGGRRQVMKPGSRAEIRALGIPVTEA